MDGLPEVKTYNQKALQIVKTITDKAKEDSKYKSVLDRMTISELYYYVISILERDNFNQNKKTDQQIVQKVLNYAKQVCVDSKDAKKINAATKDLWKVKTFEELKPFIEQNNLQVVNNQFDSNGMPIIGQGGGKIILSADKKNKLFNVLTDKVDKQMLLNLRVAGMDDHYSRKMQAQKILLSAFARQTKYYGPFIMSMIEGGQEPSKHHPAYDTPLGQNDLVKEKARTLFWDLWTFDGNALQYPKDFAQLPDKNQNPFLDLHNKIIKGGKSYSIDIGYFDFNEDKVTRNNDKQSIAKFVSTIVEPELTLVKNEFKKMLMVPPEFVVLSAINQLEKFDFPPTTSPGTNTQNDLNLAESIKYVMDNYVKLLEQAKTVFNEQAITNICNNSIKAYQDYLKQIENKKTEKELKDFLAQKDAELEKAVNEVNKANEVKVDELGVNLQEMGLGGGGIFESTAGTRPSISGALMDYDYASYAGGLGHKKINGLSVAKFNITNFVISYQNDEVAEQLFVPVGASVENILNKNFKDFDNLRDIAIWFEMSDNIQSTSVFSLKKIDFLVSLDDSNKIYPNLAGMYNMIGTEDKKYTKAEFEKVLNVRLGYLYGFLALSSTNSLSIPMLSGASNDDVKEMQKLIHKKIVDKNYNFTNDELLKIDHFFEMAKGRVDRMYDRMADFNIDVDDAQQLIQNGYLAQDAAKNLKQSLVNIFGGNIAIDDRSRSNVNVINDAFNVLIDFSVGFNFSNLSQVRVSDSLAEAGAISVFNNKDVDANELMKMMIVLRSSNKYKAKIMQGTAKTSMIHSSELSQPLQNFIVQCCNSNIDFNLYVANNNGFSFQTLDGIQLLLYHLQNNKGYENLYLEFSNIVKRRFADLYKQLRKEIMPASDIKHQDIDDVVVSAQNDFGCKPFTTLPEAQKLAQNADINNPKASLLRDKNDKIFQKINENEDPLEAKYNERAEVILNTLKDKYKDDKTFQAWLEKNKQSLSSGKGIRIALREFTNIKLHKFNEKVVKYCKTHPFNDISNADSFSLSDEIQNEHDNSIDGILTLRAYLGVNNIGDSHNSYFDGDFDGINGYDEIDKKFKFVLPQCASYKDIDGIEQNLQVEITLDEVKQAGDCVAYMNATQSGCFMDTALQSLFSQPVFLAYLLKLGGYDFKNHNKKADCGAQNISNPVLKALVDVAMEYADNAVHKTTNYTASQNFRHVAAANSTTNEPPFTVGAAADVDDFTDWLARWIQNSTKVTFGKHQMDCYAPDSSKARFNGNTQPGIMRYLFSGLDCSLTHSNCQCKKESAHCTQHGHDLSKSRPIKTTDLLFRLKQIDNSKDLNAKKDYNFDLHDVMLFINKETEGNDVEDYYCNNCKQYPCKLRTDNNRSIYDRNSPIIVLECGKNKAVTNSIRVPFFIRDQHGRYKMLSSIISHRGLSGSGGHYICKRIQHGEEKDSSGTIKDKLYMRMCDDIAGLGDYDANYKSSFEDGPFLDKNFVYKDISKAEYERLMANCNTNGINDILNGKSSMVLFEDLYNPANEFLGNENIIKKGHKKVIDTTDLKSTVFGVRNAIKAMEDIFLDMKDLDISVSIKENEKYDNPSVDVPFGGGAGSPQGIEGNADVPFGGGAGSPQGIGGTTTPPGNNVTGTQQAGVNNGVTTNVLSELEKQQNEDFFPSNDDNPIDDGSSLDVDTSAAKGASGGALLSEDEMPTNMRKKSKSDVLSSKLKEDDEHFNVPKKISEDESFSKEKKKKKSLNTEKDEKLNDEKNNTTLDADAKKKQQDDLAKNQKKAEKDKKKNNIWVKILAYLFIPYTVLKGAAFVIRKIVEKVRKKSNGAKNGVPAKKTTNDQQQNVNKANNDTSKTATPNQNTPTENKTVDNNTSTAEERKQKEIQYNVDINLQSQRQNQKHP